MTTVDGFIEHVSEKPWSDYTSSDYSIDQWHKACLIHQHEGSPTSKGQCKIPVRTPNGALNRNGIHAAAAALAGARGGVNASSEDKKKASNALLRYYRELDEKPPSSLAEHSNLKDFLVHHGIKGMRWGIRRRVGPNGKVSKSPEAQKVESTLHKAKKKGVRSLSNKDLADYNKRLELETKFGQLQPKSSTKKGHDAVKGILAAGATVNAAIAFAKSPAGKSIAAKLGKKTAQEVSS